MNERKGSISKGTAKERPILQPLGWGARKRIPFCVTKEKLSFRGGGEAGERKFEERERHFISTVLCSNY